MSNLIDDSGDHELSENESLYERLSIIIDRGQEPLRIDKFLMQRIEEPPVIKYSKP